MLCYFTIKERKELPIIPNTQTHFNEKMKQMGINPASLDIHIAQVKDIPTSGYYANSCDGLTDGLIETVDILTHLLYIKVHFLWYQFSQSIVLWML